MKAVILAAGYSGRKFLLMRDRPKGLILIKDKPIVGHIIDRIRELRGVDRIYLVTNEKYKKLYQAWFNDPKVEIISDLTKDKKEQLGAVGSLNFLIKNKNLNDNLLVVGSDNLFNFSLHSLVNEKNKIKIGVYDIKDIDEAVNYGVVEIEGDKIKKLEEKPEKAESTLISTACYYLPKESIKFVDSFIQEKDGNDLGHLINYFKDKNEVYIHKFEGKWFDVGTDSNLREARKEY
ncbi:MAG: nucleotidyltransferase family protein [Candidatus Nanoarchaeia archaeon]|nr:nucleotidyltransferase family protein [Candidatus Nanoarchaeia archaeon]